MGRTDKRRRAPRQQSAAAPILAVFQPSEFTEGGSPGTGFNNGLSQLGDWIEQVVETPTADAAEASLKAAQAARAAVSHALTATIGMGLLVGGGVIHGGLSWLGDTISGVVGGKRVARTVVHPALKRIEAAMTEWEQSAAQQVQSQAHEAVRLHNALSELRHTVTQNELAAYVGGLVSQLNNDFTLITGLQQHMRQVRHDLYSAHSGVIERQRHMRKTIMHLETTLGTAHKPKSGTIFYRIYGLRRDVDSLQSQLKTPTTTHGATLHSLYIDIHGHDGLLHRVTELETRDGRLSTRIDDLETQLKQHHRVIIEKVGLSHHQDTMLKRAYNFAEHAAPLLGLLPLSVREIRNLRKLANEPCQCKGSIPKGRASDDATTDDLIITEGP